MQQIMEQQLYTTPQAAQMTGIPEGTIRSWLSRHAGVFEVGQHIIIEESGRKLWTDEGLEILKSRKTTLGTATENATASAANSDADGDFVSPTNFLETILDHGSEELAMEYFNQLPGRTLERIRRMLHSPTAEERLVVKNSVQEAITLGRVQLLAPRENFRSLPYAAED